jgi:hypothetical protein
MADLIDLRSVTGQILVAVVDETYGVSEDDTWDSEREKYRLELEAEFKMPFEEANIGPGADLPAFVTLLTGTATVPVWTLLAAAFFLGKPLNDNLSAWREMGQKLRVFFKRPIYLNRDGAAVIACDTIIDELGHIPTSMRLVSYRINHVAEPDDLASMDRGTEIEEAPRTLYLGFIRHIFEIEADDALFRVGIEGKTAQLLRLD